MKTEPETPALKLFVVGESGGDPRKWNEWSSRVLVIAADECEVRAMCGDECTEIAEVRMTVPAVLCRRIVRN